MNHITQIVYTVVCLVVAYGFWCISKEYNKLQYDLFMQRKAIESIGDKMNGVKLYNQKCMEMMKVETSKQQNLAHAYMIQQHNQQRIQPRNQIRTQPKMVCIKEEPSPIITEDIMGDQSIHQTSQPSQTPQPPQSSSRPQTVHKPQIPVQSVPRNMNVNAPAKTQKVMEAEAFDKSNIDNINMASCEVEIHDI